MPASIRALLPLLCVAPLLAARARADVYCECLPATSPCGNPVTGSLSAGCTNSAGVSAFLGPIGSLSVSSDDLVLSSFNLPADAVTLLMMGGGAKQLPFGDGVLCVSAGAKGIYRFPPQHAGATGAVASGPGLAGLATTLFRSAGSIVAGDTWHFQRWYRDPGGPCGSGFNLTNGLALTFVP